MRNVVSPYVSLQGKASREASPWTCGYEIAEQANAGPVMGPDTG